jgi:hypothetical protein
MLALLRAIESQFPSMLDMGMNMDMGAGGAGDGLTGNQLTAVQGLQNLQPYKFIKLDS